MIAVLMGPAGSGKSTIGRALAERLDWPFVDADDLHSAASIAKMARGVGLDDDDRAAWLDRVNEAMRDAAATGSHLVVACSALRQRHRTRLAHAVPDVRWIHLRVDREVLHARLAMRQGHFAGPALLDTQLAALEPPIDAIDVDATAPVHVAVDRIGRELHRDR